MHGHDANTTPTTKKDLSVWAYICIYMQTCRITDDMVREGIQTPVGNVCTHIVASNGSKILHFDVHRYDDVLDYCTFL